MGGGDEFTRGFPYIPTLLFAAASALAGYRSYYDILQPWLEMGSLLGAIIFYAGCFSFVMMWICYFRICFTSRGAVPSNWDPSGELIDPTNVDDEFALKYCDKCQAWQPPRSNHCKKCNRCFFHRQMHCGWMKLCIGETNFKFYALMMWYGSWYYGALNAASAYWIYENYWLADTFQCVGPCGYVLFFFVTDWMMYMMFASLLSICFTNIMYNISSSELPYLRTVEKEKVLLRQYETLQKAGKNTPEHDLEHQQRLLRYTSMPIWPYDFGQYQNWKIIMGDNVFLQLLPIAYHPQEHRNGKNIIYRAWYNARDAIKERRRSCADENVLNALSSPPPTSSSIAEAAKQCRGCKSQQCAKPPEERIFDSMPSMEYSAGAPKKD